MIKLCEPEKNVLEDYEYRYNSKARIQALESILKVIWTWAHCAETDPTSLEKQLKQIEKKAEEALKS